MDHICNETSDCAVHHLAEKENACRTGEDATAQFISIIEIFVANDHLPPTTLPTALVPRMVTQRPTKRSKPSHAPRPSSSRAAAAPSDSDSEDEEDAGSEEDEWANERTHKQQSTSRRQYADEDDDSYEARANGIAQFDDEEDYEEEEEMDEEVSSSRGAWTCNVYLTDPRITVYLHAGYPW